VQSVCNGETVETRLSELLPNRVSVVMAAYNAAATIGETLDSVLAQTHTDIEVIVCDDASTDGTADIVRGYSDPRVMLLRNEENLGPGPSRDRAIRCASGEWIALVDADDMLHRDRIRRLLLSAGPDRDVMVFDNMLECHQTPQGLVPWRQVRKRGEFGVKDGQSADVALAAWLDRPRLIMHPLIPTHVIRNAGIFHSSRRFAEDTEFFLAILAKGLRLRYVANALYYYRITPGSLSSYNQRWDGVAKIYLDAIEHFSDRPDVVAALKRSVRRANDLHDYRKWLTNIRQRRFSACGQAALANPRLLVLTVKKLFADGVYWVHRLINSGQART